jgi:hypothetical protein
MTSLLKSYAQRDNSLETITLTGFISNNGIKNGGPGEQHPAYAGIDLTKSKNFNIDARGLTLRTDNPLISSGYLLRIYINSTKPPSYNPNFEFDIFITPPVTGGNGPVSLIEIYPSKASAEKAQTTITDVGRLYRITNQLPNSPGDYSDLTGTLTFKVLNNTIILKSIPPSYSS